MKLEFQDILLILIPSIIGYTAQGFCGIGVDAGSTVKFRPPKEVFGVVWVILYLLFGISWAIANRNYQNKILVNLSYAFTSVFLGLWIVFYACKNDKKVSSWILLACIAFIITAFSQGNYISKMLLSPLIAWLFFALLMNVTEVQNLM
jgi:tryptophan-rich sensory protein